MWDRVKKKGKLPNIAIRLVYKKVRWGIELKAKQLVNFCLALLGEKTRQKKNTEEKDVQWQWWKVPKGWKEPEKQSLPKMASVPVGTFPLCHGNLTIIHLARQPGKIHEKLPDAAGAFDRKARCPFQLNIKKG